MKSRAYPLLAVIAVLAAVLYYVLQVENSGREAASLSTIRVGILPDEKAEQIRARFGPLRNYLSVETGYDFRLIESSGYDELEDLFIGDEIDLAYFGGYTFIRSHLLHGAVPLVMRDIDARFTSYFIAAGHNSAQELEDFRGQAFSFGSHLSTSGHLMPRYFMRQQDIVPEDFFGEIRFSGAHDRTAYQVRDGEVDLGVANSEIIDTMLGDGRLTEKDLRIIWETPPFADYVWAVQEHLPDAAKNRLRDAFLALDPGDAHDRKILGLLGARVLIPAGINDFSALKQVAESLQMSSLEVK